MKISTGFLDACGLATERKRLWVIVGLLTLLSTANAELPSIRFDRMTPLGGAAGASVEVEILGADIEEVRTLHFDHPGLTAEHLKDRRFRITVASDVPAGTYDVRLVGRFGVSNPRLFAVSEGLAELVEKEPNDDPDTAQSISVNAVINGASDQNREDVYRVALKRGQRVVIECQAGKLDSALDASLVLTNADGRQLASNGDYNGRDPLLDFTAPDDGDFLIRVNDLSFRGGHPYRLVVTDRPWTENVFPRAVQVGKPTTLAVYGRNLGPTAKPSPWKDAALEETTMNVVVPPDLIAEGLYRFIQHPTDHSVLPTAATSTLTGFQVQYAVGATRDLNAVPLLVVDSPVSVETEPNDTQDQAQKVTLPLVFSGRFDRPRDADWFEFEAEENGPYFFEVYSERIGGRADPYLVVVDDKGNRVAELDDFGPRVNAFDGHLRDPYGSVNLMGKRTYRVLVQDRYGRGGARFQYVLRLRRPQPDFYVSAIHHQNPGPGGTTLRRGGAVYLDVILHPRDGFNGPVTLTAENLPPGLHARPTTLTGDRGVFVLWADTDAPEWTGPIRLVATGKPLDTTLRRVVRPTTRIWTDTNMSASRPMRDLVIAVRESAPFALDFGVERLEVEAGQKAEVKLNLKRHWPEFKNAVTVLPLSPPPGIRTPNAEIAAAASETTVTVEVQPNARPGEYALTLLGQAQVPYSKDTAATQKPNTLVSLPSRSLTVVVVPKK